MDEFYFKNLTLWINGSKTLLPQVHNGHKRRAMKLVNLLSTDTKIVSTVKINNRKLLRLIDKEKKSQSEAARTLNVSRQAVSKRLQELRGRKTRVVAAKKIEQAVNTNFDAMTQLLDINKKTISLLDDAEKDPELSLKCIAEIRNQIKLASDIYQTMYSIQVVDEFMQTVTDILKGVDSDVFQEFKRKLNGHRSIKSALRLN